MSLLTAVRLVPEPLTEAAFAPFGSVIDLCDITAAREINHGTTERVDFGAEIETAWNGGRTALSLFRSVQATALPFAVRFLERHPHSSQAFLPIDGSRFLVVVAPAGPEPDPGDVRAFLSRGEQGVNYRAGVWHHPLLALREGDVFLVVDRVGPGNDCEKYAFDGTKIQLLDWRR